jgi:hypothetical protein
MLTHSPLPTWINLFRALLSRPPGAADLAAPWRREGELAGWLSRSAWSLALIALWRKNRAPAAPVTVWIPDYFCNASLAALRQTGAKLLFYAVTDKMTPDFAACRKLVDAGPPDLFVLVHYFGQPTAAAAARDFCARHGAWLVEDAAHVLYPVDGIGTYGDFVLYSPHKHLPIPDGAVLVVRRSGSGKFGEADLASFGSPDSWPGQLREVQQQLGCPDHSCRTGAAAWLVKRVLQKFGVRSWRWSTSPFDEPLNPSSAVSTPLTAPSSSGLAQRLVACLLSALGAAARRRQRHQLVWDALFLNHEGLGSPNISATERPVNREWTPYLAAYQGDPVTAKETYNQWQRHGLPVTTWPDLPPEVVTDRANHANAWHLRHSRLYLPLHQSLSIRGLLKRCRSFTVAKESEPCLRLVWDSATRKQWQHWVIKAGRSNLLQSWAYGEAKSDHTGWQVKRGVYYRENEPVAIVQMLEKRVAGLLRVVRLNRGPLFLEALMPQEQYAVWKELARIGSLWRGCVFSAAPELILTGLSLVFMTDLGFRQFSPQAWESVWVDLGFELDALRKRIDSKWRNMLTFSEKAGLKMDIGSDDERFNWMMARYQELMQEKSFSGPDVTLLLNLRRHAGDEDPLIILRALHEGEPVAGICLACHGTAATYLLGWNGAEGRKLKANQYLLWQAIVYLKQAGYRWLDLGGISEELVPTITSFKLGLNGERYELVGEYWKW